jgi:hypothetical protein
MKKIAKISVGIIVLLAATAASAQDGVIRGRVGIAQNSFSSLFSGGGLTSNYQSLNTGATYILSSGWYADGALKQSIGAKWDVDGGVRADQKGNEYKRQDITLTLGKALDGGVQVFGGYQQAKSTINLGPGAANFEEHFDVKGFFVGAGKTIPMSVGSVNLNAAIGQMTGRLFDGGSVWHDSDKGTGYSLGATYSYPLAEKMTLSVEYKLQTYKYKFDANSPNTGGDDKLQVFGANVSYQF